MQKQQKYIVISISLIFVTQNYINRKYYDKIYIVCSKNSTDVICRMKKKKIYKNKQINYKFINDGLLRLPIIKILTASDVNHPLPHPPPKIHRFDGVIRLNIFAPQLPTLCLNVLSKTFVGGQLHEVAPRNLNVTMLASIFFFFAQQNKTKFRG